jgi:hypothetical protein
VVAPAALVASGGIIILGQGENWLIPAIYATSVRLEVEEAHALPSASLDSAWAGKSLPISAAREINAAFGH